MKMPGIRVGHGSGSAARWEDDGEYRREIAGLADGNNGRRPAFHDSRNVRCVRLGGLYENIAEEERRARCHRAHCGLLAEERAAQDEAMAGGCLERQGDAPTVEEEAAANENALEEERHSIYHQAHCGLIAEERAVQDEAMAEGCLERQGYAPTVEEEIAGKEEALAAAEKIVEEELHSVYHEAHCRLIAEERAVQDEAMARRCLEQQGDALTVEEEIVWREEALAAAGNIAEEELRSVYHEAHCRLIAEDREAQDEAIAEGCLDRQGDAPTVEEETACKEEALAAAEKIAEEELHSVYHEAHYRLIEEERAAEDEAMADRRQEAAAERLRGEAPSTVVEPRVCQLAIAELNGPGGIVRRVGGVRCVRLGEIYENIAEEIQHSFYHEAHYGLLQEERAMQDDVMAGECLDRQTEVLEATAEQLEDDTSALNGINEEEVAEDPTLDNSIYQQAHCELMAKDIALQEEALSSKADRLEEDMSVLERIGREEDLECQSRGDRLNLCAHYRLVAEEVEDEEAALASEAEQLVHDMSVLEQIAREEMEGDPTFRDSLHHQIHDRLMSEDIAAEELALAWEAKRQEENMLVLEGIAEGEDAVHPTRRDHLHHQAHCSLLAEEIALQEELLAGELPAKESYHDWLLERELDRHAAGAHLDELARRATLMFADRQESYPDCTSLTWLDWHRRDSDFIEYLWRKERRKYWFCGMGDVGGNARDFGRKDPNDRGAFCDIGAVGGNVRNFGRKDSNHRSAFRNIGNVGGNARNFGRKDSNRWGTKVAAGGKRKRSVRRRTKHKQARRDSHQMRDSRQKRNRAKRRK